MAWSCNEWAFCNFLVIMGTLIARVEEACCTFGYQQVLILDYFLIVTLDWVNGPKLPGLTDPNILQIHSVCVHIVYKHTKDTLSNMTSNMQMFVVHIHLKNSMLICPCGSINQLALLHHSILWTNSPHHYKAPIQPRWHCTSKPQSEAHQGAQL